MTNAAGSSLRHRTRAAFRVALISGTALGLHACGGNSAPTQPTPDEGENPDVPVAVPARGTDATFDVATWNIEWFGHAGNGPSDEETQFRRVRDVINGAQIDLWAVQEIVDPQSFDSLVTQAPGFSGVLANAPTVAQGPEYYSDFDGEELKVGLIWRESDFQVDSARVVLTDQNYEFAGRPPLAVHGRVTTNGGNQPLVVLVLHAKASTDSTSWRRRRDGSEAMKSWLDDTYPDDRVLIMGDFNDDLDESIRAGEETPYRNFLDDPDRWSFLTEAMASTDQGTHVAFDTMIDHLLGTDETAALLEEGSVEIWRLDVVIDGYADSTSDHYPVLARLRSN